MRIIKLICAAITTIALTGCAHNITISPDIAKIERSTNAQPINKSVGYYIPVASRDLSVTTPGGGGDKVSYKPYKDIETAFYKMLSGVFKSVTVLNTPSDADAISKNGLSYVFIPTLTTNSSSSSPFTWPPTQFNMELTCDISDNTGKQVATKSVTGEGKAEFAEFKSEFGLSGKRATEDALQKMQKLLLESSELKN